MPVKDAKSINIIKFAAQKAHNDSRSKPIAITTNTTAKTRPKYVGNSYQYRNSNTAKITKKRHTERTSTRKDNGSPFEIHSVGPPSAITTPMPSKV